MITRRDVLVALAAGAMALGVQVLAGERPATLASSAFDWSAVTAKATPVGSVRQFLRAPTATLAELELHVTTLNPGATSHAPHAHANEELVIVKEGAVEVLVRGEWVRLGPGSVVFNAANDVHGIRGAGSEPAVYHVINWRVTESAGRARP
jgi:quercetin dioxygenase-like cupin family protein